MLGFGEFKNKMEYKMAITQKAIVAISESFRIPKRITKVPFKKVERPMEMANPAKMYGNISLSAY